MSLSFLWVASSSHSYTEKNSFLFLGPVHDQRFSCQIEIKILYTVFSLYKEKWEGIEYRVTEDE